MNILIVDDSKKDLLHIRKLFNELKKSLDFEINISYIAEDICEQDIIEKSNNADILVIDIELGSINGIEVARKIRKENTALKIVFVSNYNKYLVDGYKARADLYLLKPIDLTIFKKEFADLILDFKDYHSGIVLKRISPTKIYFRDIIYIEILQRKSIIHFLNRDNIECYYPLKKWMELMKGVSFQQSHRAYYVNFRHISSLEKSYITLVNNEHIPLTINYKDEFESGYIKYLRRKS